MIFIKKMLAEILSCHILLADTKNAAEIRMNQSYPMSQASIFTHFGNPQASSYLTDGGLSKRLLDILGAIIGLILAAPLIGLFGWLIYRESPGSIFYTQKRIGRNGKLFTIFKLRSMRLDSESTGAGWTVENDPRCLKIGRIIRSWNIDEVPQFWNVLMGDMSLVGPRPERPEHAKRLEQEFVGFSQRHSVKPGLTGWAQVKGWRGNTDLGERLRHDIDYIQRASFLFDLAIIVRTFVSKENAY